MSDGLFDDLYNPRLIEPEPAAGMVRSDDHETSRAAAVAVARGLTVLHQRVLDAFEEHGPMTDDELERLPQFADYGPSTIRKRRSELYQAGQIETAGTKENARGRSMLVFTRTAK